MQYSRPDIKHIRYCYESIIISFQSAAVVEDAIIACQEIEALFNHFDTMLEIANIRHNLDIDDIYYENEQKYFDENAPLIYELKRQFEMLLLSSPHKKALESKFGSLLFLNIKISTKTFNSDIINDLILENKLCSKYASILASAKIQFDDKELTLSELAAYHQNNDRVIRRLSFKARSLWFMRNAEKFDIIFDGLVSVRTNMAKKMGYENFIELGYYRMQRNCYDKNMVAHFRENVAKYIVPVVLKIKANQAKRIKVSPITIYDDPYEFPDGNPNPISTYEEIIKNIKKMCHELSIETKEFIDFMLKNELFNVLPQKGKSNGFYCSYLPAYKSPFIFANFNGTSKDIELIIHEIGHAFADYVSRNALLSAQHIFPADVAEVHSMSMEIFSWPWINSFFGAQTQKYYYSHLSNMLSFIPYGAMVDEFQHLMYESPNIKSSEKNKLWLSLEKKYRPYIDMDDIPFYSDGRRWQAQTHIYEAPFYFIDYCLAHIIALLLWIENSNNHSAAWEKYFKFVSCAGTKTFLELIDTVKLRNPFEESTLKYISDVTMKWLDDNTMI